MAAENLIIDPATTDFSKFSHLIGDNEYDADMNIVESYVRAKLEPDNALAHAAVFNYLISRLIDNWQVTKDYASGSEVEVEFAEYMNKLRLSRFDKRRRHLTRLSSERIAEHEKNILKFIEQLTTKFAESGKIDIVEFNKGFGYVGSVACLEYPKYPEFTTKADDTMYPLPNTIGLFGLNTYLYAYFHGIHLIGVPTKMANADGYPNCPEIFLNHDINHSRNLQRNHRQSKFNFDKYAYFTILNDPNLTSLEKKCHIVSMWVALHEDINPNRILLELNKENLRHAEHLAAEFAKTSAGDFLEIYRSFYPLIYAQDNIESLVQFSKANGINFPIIEFIENIAEEDVNDINEGYGPYIFGAIFASFWFTARYTSELYKKWPKRK